MKKLILIIILILVLVGIGAAGYLFLGSEKTEWQTYISEEYGFEIEYPGDWKIDDLVNGFEGFYDPSTGYPIGGEWRERLSVGVIKFWDIENKGIKSGVRKNFADGKFSFREFIYEWAKFKQTLKEDSIVEEWQTLDGQIAYKIDGYGDSGDFIGVYIPKPAQRTALYLFALHYPGYPSKKNKQYDQIFKHMISSFRFLK